MRAVIVWVPDHVHSADAQHQLQADADARYGAASLPRVIHDATGRTYAVVSAASKYKLSGQVWVPTITYASVDGNLYARNPDDFEASLRPLP